MGLGKTLQAIAVAYRYKAEWPLLIIVPSSLKYPWIEELEKWLPELHPGDINLVQTGMDIGGLSSSPITVVTYGMVRHPSSKILKEALCNQQFKVIVADESHYMKNRKSATTKYLLPLIQRAERKIFLTGTPALARPEEGFWNIPDIFAKICDITNSLLYISLYPQLSALLPSIFGNWQEFSKRYCDAHVQFFGKRRRWATDGASNLEELQALLSSHVMIRRLKKDVLTQLPAKQRQRIPFDVRDSALKKDLEERWDILMAALGRKKLSVTQALAGESSAAEGMDSTGSSWFDIRKTMSELYRDSCKVKIGPVRDYVKMLSQNAGLKFIVFAHHHAMMDGVTEQLYEDHVRFIRIDGSTVQQDRPRLVQQFQVEPETRVAVLSIKAAGVGLTLTAAKLVVFAELDWTPGAMEQCEDRAHRIGQQSTVHVHYLVAKGTLDEWVWSALARKTCVVSTTLNGETLVLNMEQGNDSLVECLASADVFIPKPASEEQDIAHFFATEQKTNQRSMLDYFTPKGSAPRVKKKRGPTCADLGQIQPIEIQDSDEEARAFDSEFEEMKKWKKRKSKKASLFDESLEELGSHVSKSAASGHRLSTEMASQASSESGDICGLTRGEPLDRILDLETDKVSKEKNVTEVGSASEDSDMEAVTRELDARWSCGACTFLNHRDLPFCEICGSAKPLTAMTSRTDHVTPRADHATPHTDLVTSHTNHVTSHTNHAAPYTDHATSHTDHVTSHTDHVTSHTDDVTHRSSHVNNDVHTVSCGNDGRNRRERTGRILPSRTSPHGDLSGQSQSLRAKHISTWSGTSQVGSTQGSRDVCEESRDAVTADSVQVSSNIKSLQPSGVQHSSQNERGSMEPDHSSQNGFSQEIVQESEECCSFPSRNISTYAIEKSREYIIDSDSVRLPSPSTAPCDGSRVHGRTHAISDSEDGGEGDTKSPSLRVSGSVSSEEYQSDVDGDTDCESSHDPANHSESGENLDDVAEPFKNINSESTAGTTTPSAVPAPSLGEGDAGWISAGSSPTRGAGSQDAITPSSARKYFKFKKTSAFPGSPRCSMERTPSSECGCTSSPSRHLNPCGFRCKQQSLGGHSESAAARPMSSSITTTPGKKSVLSADCLTDADIIEQELSAAQSLLSPNRKQGGVARDDSLYPWRCPKCDLVNDKENEDCDGCLESRPLEDVPQEIAHKGCEPSQRTVDLQAVTVYEEFKYCCSPHTNRIYVYDKDGDPLDVHFTVPDVEVGNYAELPDLLLHPENMKLVKRFVKGWKTLSETKKRVVIRSGEVFSNPVLCYERVKCKTKPSKQRYLTADDVATAAATKASEIGGDVRVISRPVRPCKRKADAAAESGGNSRQDEQATSGADAARRLKGIAQVLDGEGRPLCVLCHAPYSSELLADSTIQDNPWQTRFCSTACLDHYLTQSHRSYFVDRVFEQEHGVCQMCQFDAQDFFVRIRNVSDVEKRAKLIQESKFNVLKGETKEKMVRKPVRGLVDHITPVVEGGGMCDIDNLRTLCTLCHRDVTSQQNRDRAKRRRLEQAASYGDITAFFKPI